MAFDLKTVEALAPDQTSLGAASKLARPGNWVRLEKGAVEPLIWGECQGSGANPYRVIADAGDHTSKCTCPSRKFPCKHALALMWMSVTAPGNFVVAGTPEWVTDWAGRRRRASAGPAAADGAPAAGKSIDQATTPAEPAKADDPVVAERRDAAQKKRAEETRSSIAAGLDELDQWIADQLRLGLAGFVAACGERCRRIAARLVDMKAAALASHIDELPSRLIALPSEERPEAAMRELGKLVLLVKAYRAAPDDPELKRLVATAETREQVLADPAAMTVASTWEVLGEKIETRRDGLVSHATWLLDLKAKPARFALLQDFYPASAGRRSNAFTAGDRFAARLVFYPSRTPLRALIADRAGDTFADFAWSVPDGSADPLSQYIERQNGAPWTSESPLMLPPGTIARDAGGRAWWQAAGDAGDIALPLAGDVPEPVQGLALGAMAALWNGAALDPLAAQSPFGRLDLS